jgi:crotonobetainyl-CoA:carnitine CoA-transferase CaiB-like acyl-CoA transferase
VEAFERLAATADVLVENYTPRVMEQFGLGWDRVHEVNPDLIMVRMPAFGLGGPWRDRTGFAQTMECLTGMAWLTGFPDGPPVLVRGACDPLAGMHAVIATLLALIERDESGGGRLVETVMVEAALNAAAEQVAEYGATGTVLCRDGNRGPGAAPQGVYPCAGTDRWLAVAVVTDAQWQSLREVVGDPTWAADIVAGTVADRRRNHDRIDAELTRWLSGLDLDETAARLVAAGVPACAVVPSRDIVANPQLRSRRLFEVESHPVTGDHEIPILPFRFSRVDHWLRAPAPTLGQHNTEVLGEIGLAPAALEELRRTGVVGETLRRS